MPKFKLDKLVRIGLLDIFKELDEKVNAKELHGRVLRKALADKFVEESNELGKDDLSPKELADILQLVYDAALSLGIEMSEIEDIRVAKELKKGGCVELDKNGEPYGVFVENLTCTRPDDIWIEYYRNDPEKYPEIPEET